MREKNLSDLRVLDFGRVMAGPYLGQIFADLGAEVIKIEQPGKGADERSFSPFGKGQSGYFMLVNRGKKSITLDLKNPAAKDIVLKLVRISDIVIENFKPGVMKSLGLDYEELRAVNPQIIMCSISTFGQTGPYAQKAGYDIVAQAMSGIMWMSGDPDRPPMRSGSTIGDYNASTHAFGAIMAALHYKDRSGVGQHVDIALRDCLTAILETAIPRYTMTGGEDQLMRTGSHHETMAPYGIFKAANDKYVAIGALNPSLWERLCQAIGRPDLVNNPDFADSVVRGRNLPQVISIIEGWLKGYEDVKEPLAILEKNGIPAGPVLDIEGLFDDPQLKLRELFVEVTDPIFGKVVLTGTPMKFSETDSVTTNPPPMLGEHTEEVLTKLLGYTQSDISELHEKKAI